MIELFKDLKNIIGELSEEVNTMKVNVERVSRKKVSKQKKLEKDIQKKIDEFSNFHPT